MPRYRPGSTSQILRLKLLQEEGVKKIVLALSRYERRNVFFVLCVHQQDIFHNKMSRPSLLYFNSRIKQECIVLLSAPVCERMKAGIVSRAI